MTVFRRCLQGKVFADYLRGVISPRRKAVVENHLALCAECRRLVDTASEALRLDVGTGELRDRLTRAAQVVAAIEGQASHRLEGLISTNEWGKDHFVAGRLLERSREEFARDPRASMRLARGAIRVAERADAVELQFEGWRDCVSIAVLLGSFGEAWEAIERAAALIARMVGEREHARGLVLYARAYVASQPDVWRLDEAFAWTEEASRIFARTDRSRFAATAEMRAYLHYCRDEHAAAVQICRSLWAKRRDVGLALSFVAYLVAYGKPGEAEDVLEWAREQIASSDTERVARYAWAEGRVHAARERWEDAVPRLTEAASLFREIAMNDTAIRVDLARIRAEVSAAPDSLPAVDKALDDVRQVIGESVALDQREPTRRRRFTVEAVSYLREVGEANALTADLFAHVEAYLDAITRGPARPFVRPVPARVM